MCKLAVVRALLDDRKFVDLSKSLPDLGELDCEKLSEQWADADVGEIITLPSNRGAIARVVTVFGMIKGLLHEPGKGDRTAFNNFGANDFN